MSNITARFYSNCLKRHVTFQMYLPYDNRIDPFAGGKEHRTDDPKTLFLLHGYTGDAENWIPEYLAEKYHFAIVMPNGENSFWLDGISTGHQFCSFLGEELPAFVRRTFHLAKSREDTYICGLSMGGFGALHTSLFYPEVFGKAVALSSALIVHEVAGMQEGKGNEVANFEYYRECFGDPAKLLESDNNPETLVKKRLAEGRQLPELFMAVGTDDFLLENNRQFHAFLEKLEVPHRYEEDEGGHDPQFWGKYVERYIPLLFDDHETGKGNKA